MTRTMGRMIVIAILAIVGNPLSETHGQDETLLKRLRAFPWPAYQREIGFRQNGLAVNLMLPEDQALLDDLPKLPKSRPLRVSLGGTVTDMELSRLRNVTNLESLFVDGATISADGLTHLQKLPLNELTLTNAEIQGEVFKQLAALPHLSHLDLADVKLEDADMSHLADMANLAHLSMDLAITDEQTMHLAQLKNLREFRLAKSPITDKGLQQLGRLTNLRDLLTLDSKVTEEGFQHLTDLRQLVFLVVPDVTIGEVGLGHLSRLPNLRNFLAEVDEKLLRQHLPQVAIQWTGGRLDRETSLEFVDAPLVDVAEFVSDEFDIRVQLDEYAIRLAGAHPLTPITLDGKGITLRTALRLMLRPLDLEYVVLADRILITSSEDAASRLESQVYDLDSVVAAGDQAAVAEVVATMRKAVKPAAKKPGAAPRGSLEIDGTKLTISQSQATHESIQALVTGLGPHGSRTPHRERIRRTLLRPSQLVCNDTPLSDVPRKLYLDVPILFDPTAIKAGELNLDAPVTTSARGVPTGKLLSDVLQPLKLVWVIRDDALLITSQTQADKNVELAIYHVGDLIANGQTADQLAARIRNELKFDTHADWLCSTCLNRIVVRAPFHTHLQVEGFVEQLRDTKLP